MDHISVVARKRGKCNSGKRLHRTSCKTVSAPHSQMLMIRHFPCTSVPCALQANSQNSSKSYHIFVCALHPVFGHIKERKPTEISFTNRWELVGPLGGEACFRRFSQERRKIYWFSCEKKITIQTSSLQFLGAGWMNLPSYVTVPCRELLICRCVAREQRWWMFVFCHLCFHKQLNVNLFYIKGLYIKTHIIKLCCIFLPQWAVVDSVWFSHGVKYSSRSESASCSDSPTSAGHVLVIRGNGAETESLSGR